MHTLEQIYSYQSEGVFSGQVTIPLLLHVVLATAAMFLHTSTRSTSA